MSDNPEEVRPDDDEPPETTDLTDPLAQKKARNRIRREQQEAESLWRAVFANKIGRREMWRMLQDDCHGFSPPFACGPNGFPQVEATWLQAGQYSIGQRLYQRWLRISPQGVHLMHEENDPQFIKPKRLRQRAADRGDN